MTGGINEVWCLLVLLVCFKLYRSDHLSQREVSERLQKLEQKNKMGVQPPLAKDPSNSQLEAGQPSREARTSSVVQPQSLAASEQRPELK